jgi:hypothetical protein
MMPKAPLEKEKSAPGDLTRCRAMGAIAPQNAPVIAF